MRRGCVRRGCVQGLRAGVARKGCAQGLRARVARAAVACRGCITVCPWLPLVAPSNHRFSG